MNLRLTTGQAGGAPTGETLIEAIDPRKRVDHAAPDKAYDSDRIRRKLKAKGIEPVIPPKAKRREALPYDRELYKQRNKIGPWV